MNMATGKKRRRAGFTVLEMAVSVAIFITVVAVCASILTKLTGFYVEALARSDLMESGKVTQEQVFSELFSARVVSLAGTASTDPVLTFVVPVEQPTGTGGSDFVDADGDINWGAVEPTGPQLDLTGDPHRVTLRAAVTGTVAEADARLDLNSDGDLGDSFQVGSLVLRTTGGLERILIPQRLIIGQVGGGIFDIDGDGVVDPLVQLQGESFVDANGNGIYDRGEAFTDDNGNGRWDGSLSISFPIFSIDRNGQGHRIVYRTAVRLLHNS
ncbi:MAG: hypothetical protein HY717_00935 [Planctomycetes bacterium]|nr:hypothetical protein [Planctomycetota bacterium]